MRCEQSAGRWCARTTNHYFINTIACSSRSVAANMFGTDGLNKGVEDEYANDPPLVCPHKKGRQVSSMCNHL
jgi:hypothetical protein